MTRDDREELKRFLRGRIEAGWAEGFATAVSDGDGTIVAEYEGETSAGLSGERVTVDQATIFNIGSVTKPVTAVLLAKLAEEGLLTLADKVRSFIPEYPFGDTDLFHLLSHSAGYDNAISLERPLVRDGEAARLEYLSAIYGIDTRKSEPGESVLYFTEGYVILMDLIQRAVGANLESLAREVLFDPLGMSRSTFDVVSVRDDVHTVFPVAQDGRVMLEIADWATTGDSGLYTHVEDLMKFGRMFLNGGAADGRQVLHERTVDWLLADASGGRFNQTPAFWIKGGLDRYGCFGDLHSPRAVGHTGFSGCMLWIDPACGVAGTVLTNSTKLHDDWTRYKRINNRLLSLPAGIH